MRPETTRRPYRQRTDAQLVAACRSADAGAWDELLARHGGLIYSTARQQGLSTIDADDVFQNVCVLLLQNLDTLREPHRLTAWLLAVTRREAWRFGRIGGRESDPLSPFETDDGPAPGDALLALEERHLVELGLEQLAERCRSLLRQLYFTDPPPTYETIARERDWSVGSVGPNRTRCLERLRKILAELGY